jgi:hypothetical protein
MTAYIPPLRDIRFTMEEVVGLDAVTALPFARLRAENRPWRFAGIKMAEIFVVLAPAGVIG